MNIKSDFISRLIKDKALFLSFICILIGLLGGSFIFIFTEDAFHKEIISLFVSFFTQFKDKSKAEIFCGIATEGIIYFAALFLCGSNIFGKELSLALTGIKAAGITAIITSLYTEYALKGFEYCLLVFIPGKIILILSMLFMTKSAFEFSSSIRSNSFDNNSIKAYIIKGLFSFIFMLFSWILDFITIIIFSSLFNFK